MEFYGFPPGGVAGEMAGYALAKVKRKELEEVYDEFSEFSLSSPARKIRRLDAELPPIMEEEEPAATLVFGQPLPEEELQICSKQLTSAELTNAEASTPLNDERAIVLYKPVNVPVLDSSCPSNVFLSVDPDMIAGFKNQVLWRSRQNIVKTRDEEAEASSGNGQAAGTSCLAVVPWMPSQVSEPANVSGAKNRLVEQEMAPADAEGSSMDIEVEQGQANGVTIPGIAAADGLQHWQQHCMTTQVGASESTPVMWSWG
ncbi:hypothetical protein Taro_010142 [Colocasia esculenta]|uniref:Uncharacterized protein n=1 Tax=Colocasia esculenta TaxID=4460 RepID=A0A843U267_COLES|nr:hypothetical protein [Colocasia esculenta]